MINKFIFQQLYDTIRYWKRVYDQFQVKNNDIKRVVSWYTMYVFASKSFQNDKTISNEEIKKGGEKKV